jgi:FkbM family methyltransferase
VGGRLQPALNLNYDLPVIDEGTPAVSSTTDRKTRVERLEQKIDSLHRTVLEKAVLQGLLPIRARVAALRSAAPDARQREQRFREASPAYAREIANAESLASSTRVISLDSLTWWVPLLRPDDPTAVDRALGGQDFPYRVILQTREVGLGGLMLDIGANTGRMAVPRAILGDVTAVYCAEPDLLNYQCLVRNVRDNHLTGLVLPDHLAVASEDGVVRLERAKTTGGHRVIDQGVATTRTVTEVPALTVDSWMDRLAIAPEQVVFVKVDVQGSEVPVLRGATRLLAHRHVAWQIEIDLQAVAGRGFVEDDLFQPLRDHFSHFIDLSRRGVGDRVRSIAELTKALAYLQGGAEGRTDILLFSLHS